MWYVSHSALGTTWTKGVKYIKKIGDKYIYPAVKSVGRHAKKLKDRADYYIDNPNEIPGMAKRKAKAAYDYARDKADDAYDYARDKVGDAYDAARYAAKRGSKMAAARAHLNRLNRTVRENEEEAAYTNANRRVQAFKNKGNPDAIRENREETAYTNANRIRKKEAKRNENIEKARKNIRNKADTDITYMRKYIEEQKKLANELNSKINELRRRNPPVDRSYIKSLESQMNAALDEVRLNKRYIKQLMDNPSNIPYNYGQRRASREKMNSTRT